MTTRLELLQTIERPPGADAFTWCTSCSPDRRWVGLPGAPDTLQVYELGDHRLLPGAAFPLPELEELEVAIRPDGQQIAVASSQGVQLVDPDGTAHAIGEELKGVARAALYSHDGQRLWIGYEDLEADQAPGGNFVCLADCATLGLIDTLRVAGLGDAYHALTPLPGSDLVAVEVSCGQGGSWLTLVEPGAFGLSRLTAALERPGEPFLMGGFSPDGARLAVVDLGRAALHETRSCELRAEIAPPGPDDVFCWSCTWIDDALVVGAVTQPNDPYVLLFCDGRDLEPRARAVWDKGDQDSIGALLGLPGARLLVLGDRRAGLFSVVHNS